MWLYSGPIFFDVETIFSGDFVKKIAQVITWIMKTLTVIEEYKEISNVVLPNDGLNSKKMRCITSPIRAETRNNMLKYYIPSGNQT